MSAAVQACAALLNVESLICPTSVVLSQPKRAPDSFSSQLDTLE
jgi:hypothetical protein